MNLLGVSLLATGIFLAMETPSIGADSHQVVLAVHGGLAGPRTELTSAREAEIRRALQQALTTGYQEIMAKRGESARAVVAAVKVLEDSPHFNAGKGAVLTSAKTVELDAAIMEGEQRRAGAVAAAMRIRNPIEGALAVMEHRKYVLLVGAGADAFAKEQGLQIVEPEYFFTEQRLKQFERIKASRAAVPDKATRDEQGENRGTVGAVAIDHAGTLAAATSTGGLAFKIPGRVGDSPIIGAGTYADSRACAVSATGDGEFFIRSCTAFDVFAKMFYKDLAVEEAANEAIQQIRRMGGEGGLIALDRKGNLAMPFAAHGMYRGFIDRKGDVQIDLYGGNH
jgi:beta-aspartyl-peptidase (threonine type)